MCKISLFSSFPSHPRSFKIEVLTYSCRKSIHKNAFKTLCLSCFSYSPRLKSLSMRLVCPDVNLSVIFSMFITKVIGISEGVYHSEHLLLLEDTYLKRVALSISSTQVLGRDGQYSKGSNLLAYRF